MKFAEKLSNLIDARDTNQSRLMRVTGIAQSTISAMTRGERRPSMDQAFKLARALDVSVDYLADDRQDAPPPPGGIDPDAHAIIDLFRALGLTKEEGLRRLACAGRPTAPAPKKPHGDAAWLGGTDETELDAATRRRENAPKKVGRGKKPAPGGKRR